MKVFKIFIAAMVSGLILAGCAGAPAPTLSATEVVTVSSDGVEIDIKLFNFPDVVEVAVGTTVTWTNLDNTQHSVSSGTPDAPGDLFDSGFFEQDGTFSFTFTEPGDYAYFCMRHNHMQGIIRVVAE
jgi:plastocyanin